MTSSSNTVSVERVIAAPPEKIFDLLADPAETRALAGALSPSLKSWMAEVQKGLAASDRLAPAEVDVDPESVAKLRALGYGQ